MVSAKLAMPHGAPVGLGADTKVEFICPYATLDCGLLRAGLGLHRLCLVILIKACFFQKCASVGAGNSGLYFRLIFLLPGVLNLAVKIC